MSSLWLSIEPLPSMTKLLLSEASGGTALKARLPPTPADPRALAMLLEALVAWYGEPLCAVLDADAADVQQDPRRWALILGDLSSPQIEVEWVSPSAAPLGEERLLGEMGDYRRARRLITLAATGLR